MHSSEARTRGAGATSTRSISRMLAALVHVADIHLSNQLYQVCLSVGQSFISQPAITIDDRFTSLISL